MTVSSVNLEGTTPAIARWMWQHLVPKSGQAASVQGELLRAVEKLSWEAVNNGNANWDGGFEQLVDFLRETLLEEPALTPEMKRTVSQDLDTVAHFEAPCLDDAVYDRLTDAVVAYCRVHPGLIMRCRNPALMR